MGQRFGIAGRAVGVAGSDGEPDVARGRTLEVHRKLAHERPVRGEEQEPGSGKRHAVEDLVGAEGGQGVLVVGGDRDERAGMLLSSRAPPG